MSSARWACVGCLVAVGLALPAVPADAATLRLGAGGIARVSFGTNWFVSWNPPWRDRTVYAYPVAL
jgi:hypothetical protein